nr:putative reverse transcriptase domain-containing protein [Tanacetum cinerariifolium]
MIQVKEMIQDKDLKNSKLQDEGSRSRSQSMNDQSHYKQAKTKTNDKTRQPPSRKLSVIQECQLKRSSPQQRRSLMKETSTLREIKDGSFRMCIDYQELNKLTVKNRYPLPSIDDLFDQLQGSNVYSKLDLRLGVFMDLMNRVCKIYLDKFVIIFIDNILIYSRSKKEHEEYLKAILELLKKEEFQGIHVNLAKIESIKDWTSPKTPTEIRQFLGLTRYYRRFIEGFSKIAKSMFKLTQKGVNFDWGDKEEAAFQLIKQKLCSALILALPEGSEDFVVYCDASNKGLGVVFMQREKSCSSITIVKYVPPEKANVVTDALSRKERNKPLRVQALVMTIGLNLSKQILKAQIEAQKPEIFKKEDV